LGQALAVVWSTRIGLAVKDLDSVTVEMPDPAGKIKRIAYDGESLILDPHTRKPTPKYRIDSYRMFRVHLHPKSLTLHEELVPNK
jgi:hypothetical protein